MRQALIGGTWLYPDWDNPETGEGIPHGEAKKVPAGIPVIVIRQSTTGRGRQKVTRYFIRTNAPAGWGEFSKTNYYGWVHPELIGSTNPAPRKSRGAWLLPLEKNPHYKAGWKDGKRGVYDPGARRSAAVVFYNTGYERAKRGIHRNPAPRIGTRNAMRRSQATGRAPSRRLIRRRRRNTAKGFFPNPSQAAALQSQIYGNSMKRKKRSKIRRKSARRSKRRVAVPSQFAGLPFLLKVRGAIVAGFRDKKRALQYGRKLSRHERAPVSLLKR